MGWIGYTRKLMSSDNLQIGLVWVSGFMGRPTSMNTPNFHDKQVYKEKYLKIIVVFKNYLLLFNNIILILIFLL